MLKATMQIMIGLVIAVLIIESGNFLSFWNFSFFAPKVEQVRYNTFENSQSYNDGMIRDLQEFQLEWAGSTDSQKDTIRAVVLQRFSHYDESRLPTNLQLFYDQQIKGNQP